MKTKRRNQQLHEAVCSIEVVTDSGRGQASGFHVKLVSSGRRRVCNDVSGSLVRGQRPKVLSCIVTCAHVVNDMVRGYVTFDDYVSGKNLKTWHRLCPEMLLYIDPINDVACVAVSKVLPNPCIPCCSTGYDSCLERNIAVIHHPGGRPKEISRGHIALESDRGVEGSGYFLHTADCEEGSSGSPIMCSKTVKAIGLHCGIATLMLPPKHESDIGEGMYLYPMLAALNRCGFTIT
jgi:hypothetical protein